MAGLKRMEFMTLQGYLRCRIKGGRKFSKELCQRHLPNLMVGSYRGGRTK